VETAVQDGAAPCIRHGEGHALTGAFPPAVDVLLVKGRSSTKLVRGAVIAQGWVRGSDGTTRLSDDVLGQGLTLIGFGVDAAAALEHATDAAFARAEGRVVQIVHRGQRLHLAPRDTGKTSKAYFFPGWCPTGGLP
jgi:3-(3-hydroxy-phenyl)propionate hydroxylase